MNTFEGWLPEFLAWAASTPQLRAMALAHSADQAPQAWAAQLVAQLQASGAVRLEGALLINL